MKKIVSLTATATAAALFSAAGIAFAAGLKENKALSSAGLSVRSMEVPLPAAPAAPETRSNKIGTIKGAMNYTPVAITINKTEWTIKGAMNYSPVDIKIDHEAGTITGGANLSPVGLKFAWSREEITVEGGANLSPVKYTVNWKNGLLEGYTNHSPLKLAFDMQEGVADAVIIRVAGYVNRATVDLTYNKTNGHIGGAMNRSPVDLTLVNCGLYDFLTYFFIFVNL